MDHQSSDYKYLEKLEFHPRLRRTWLNFFVTNFRVVILLIIILSSWGIYSFFQLPLESNPEVKIPFAVIVTPYPGAGPADVEELVTKKIETEISSVKGIKKITSTSSNSVSSISVEFDTKENQDEALRKLRDKVSTIKDLPDDANDPQVNEVSFDDRPIYTIVLSGSYDGFVLRQMAEKIQNELEKIPTVREIKIFGGDEKEFSVAYDPEKLSSYNISADAANQAIAATNRAVPGGNFEGREYNYPIRTDAKFYDAQTLGDIPILHTNEGAIVYLKDLALVEEKAIKKTIYSRLSIKGAQPQNAVTIDVIKKTGGSIIDTVDQTKTTLDQMSQTFPAGMTYDVTIDFAKQIRKDFDQLTHDFILTLILVFGILFLIVGLKEAIVAGLAIPLVFFATFGVMLMTGITLNFLSIFSLLLSLGLLVDDAIVVVSATKQYLKTGKFTPEEAVLLVLNDFKVVLTTTTLTTIWAFLPLLLSSGIMGEFIKSIPITVSVTLFSSLLIALMINHPLAAVLERVRLTKGLLFLDILLIAGIGYLGYLNQNTFGYLLLGAATIAITATIFWFFKGGREKLAENQRLSTLEWQDDELIKKKLRQQGSHENQNFFSRLLHGIIKFDSVIPLYEKFLRLATSSRKRRLSLLFAVLLLFLGAIYMPISGIVPSEFFPASDFENIYINIEAPIGLKLEETDKIVQQAEDKLLHYPQILNFSTIVGQPGVDPSGGGSSFSSNVSHLGSIVVTIVERKERDITSYDLATRMRQDLEEIKGATIRVEAPRGGPPSGAAFEDRIKGDDLQTLDKIAKDLRPLLSSIPGVVDIKTSLKVAPAEYTFQLDPARLELYNLNATAVGSTIRMAISGSEITTVLKDNKEIKVQARFQEEKIPNLESIQNLQIINSQRQPVYLKDVSQVELHPSVDSITRIDQKRAVLLSAGVAGTTRPNEVLAQFQEKLAKDYQLPTGYSIVYGGENEQNQESVLSIIRAMAIAGALIISTLIMQFNSIRKSLIVLVTVPLALIGVFYGMAIAGIALSFPGLIGILALFGIVVKNAIILVDKMNLNLKSGIPFYEAVIDAGKSRLEAIFITSICTILGIIPVTLSNETWTALGSVVIFGLMLSSFFTLFIVPALFLTLVKERH